MIKRTSSTPSILETLDDDAKSNKAVLKQQEVKVFLRLFEDCKTRHEFNRQFCVRQTQAVNNRLCQGLAALNSTILAKQTIKRSKLVRE
jgi:hypothetical protein